MKEYVEGIKSGVIIFIKEVLFHIPHLLVWMITLYGADYFIENKLYALNVVAVVIYVWSRINKDIVDYLESKYL